MRSLDHILVSSELEIGSLGTLDLPFSDHLPVAMDIILPEPLLSKRVTDSPEPE